MDTLPDSLFQDEPGDVEVFDYTTENQINRSKVILTQNVISFLIEGHKEVNFSGTTTALDHQKALMMIQGNCIMTEQGNLQRPYRSILFFFSRHILKEFFIRSGLIKADYNHLRADQPCFLIEKDGFIEQFIQSLQLLIPMEGEVRKKILLLKFEEIMVYLTNKYGRSMITFLQNSIDDTYELSFRTTIESNKFSVLSVEEIAFLCNMSISTFKRHFKDVYGQTPGKWFKSQQLGRAKEMLQNGETQLSQIHTIFGYENLSNFSTAFKKEFGFSPSELRK